VSIFAHQHILEILTKVYVEDVLLDVKIVRIKLVVWFVGLGLLDWGMNVLGSVLLGFWKLVGDVLVVLIRVLRVVIVFLVVLVVMLGIIY
jgi:hypothetical protein